MDGSEWSTLHSSGFTTGEIAPDTPTIRGSKIVPKAALDAVKESKCFFLYWESTIDRSSIT
jgi:hypothetical protein